MRSHLIWVNEDSTVMVTRYEDGATLYVALREDSDAIWGPPIACKADAETAKIMDVARIATAAAAGELGMGDN